MAQHTVHDVGLSVVYEPEAESPLVDIVIVHGLQGHPFKTFACAGSWSTKTATESGEALPSGIVDGRRNSFRRLIPTIRRLTTRSSVVPAPPVSSDCHDEDTRGSDEGRRNFIKAEPTFWPRDLLPTDCPNSRIMVYGYDTNVTRYMAGATNKSTLFSHGKDLLFALATKRPLDRRLLFLGHSLGGIVIKEMLAKSAASTENDLTNVVESTAAVVFLGTPHRGSSDIASVGEWARSFVSIFRMETNSAILDALGLRTSDLERAQETFSTLWHKYDFRVKTFQEGLGLTGVNLGVLGNKVVPDYSSVIGDARERAETLQANHMDMCRFDGPHDPNYLRVSGEVSAVYSSIMRLHEEKIHRDGKILRYPSTPSVTSRRKRTQEGWAQKFSDEERAALRSLWFPSINSRFQKVRRPVENTCHWLFEDETYQGWLNGRDMDKHSGLLWIRGKPGTGKSTLLKEAFRRTAEEQMETGHLATAHFFNAKGTDDLDRSALGLFRSLLYQLLPQYPEHLQTFVRQQRQPREQDPYRDLECRDKAALEALFESIFTTAQSTNRRVIAFVDALDECDAGEMRSQAYFWRQLTRAAHKAGHPLSVCLSSRHFPNISVVDCLTIVVEHNNTQDIVTYVDQKLGLGIDLDHDMELLALKERILRKSTNIFLWVVLVVDSVLKRRDEGIRLRALLKDLDSVPEALGELFSQLLSGLGHVQKQKTLRFFQWVVFAARPLRIHEWHHILAFIGDKVPSSLLEWRASDEFTETDDQLEKQIRSISRGLVEISYDCVGIQASETMSSRAGAGSLDLEHGETRTVQFIHESVREFFMQGAWLEAFWDLIPSNPPAHGHLCIMRTILDYINITELDALVCARKACQFEKATSDAKGSHAPRFLVSSEASTPSSSIPTIIPRQPLRKRMSFETVFSFESAGSHTSQTTTQSSLLVLNLKSDPIIQQPLDVSGWIEEVSGSNDDGKSITSSAHSSSAAHSSGTEQTRLLEDYPALLLYATSEFFAHAKVAQEAMADPRVVIDHLQKDDNWGRFAFLCDNIRQGTGLLYYSAVQGLTSWMDYLGGSLTCPTHLVAGAVREAALSRNKFALEAILNHYEYRAQFNPFAPTPVLPGFAQLADIGLLRVFLSRRAVWHPDNSQLFDEPDEWGRTALHVAAGRQDVAVTLELLEHGADPNRGRDMLQGGTPLHSAFSRNTMRGKGPDGANGKKREDSRYEVVKALLEHGADVNAVDSNGCYPLHRACENIVRSQRRSERGSSTLADHEMSIWIVDLLLEYKSEANKPDDMGRTPLQICASGLMRSRLFTKLLASGADFAGIRGSEAENPSDVGDTPLTTDIVGGLIR